MLKQVGSKRGEAVAAQLVGCWGKLVSEVEAEGAESVGCWGWLGVTNGVRSSTICGMLGQVGECEGLADRCTICGMLDQVGNERGRQKLHNQWGVAAGRR